MHRFPLHRCIITVSSTAIKTSGSTNYINHFLPPFSPEVDLHVHDYDILYYTKQPMNVDSSKGVAKQNLKRRKKGPRVKIRVFYTSTPQPGGAKSISKERQMPPTLSPGVQNGCAARNTKRMPIVPLSVYNRDNSCIASPDSRDQNTKYKMKIRNQSLQRLLQFAHLGYGSMQARTKTYTSKGCMQDYHEPWKFVATSPHPK